MMGLGYKKRKKGEPPLALTWDERMVGLCISLLSGHVVHKLFRSRELYMHIPKQRRSLRIDPGDFSSFTLR